MEQLQQATIVMHNYLKPWFQHEYLKQLMVSTHPTHLEYASPVAMEPVGSYTKWIVLENVHQIPMQSRICAKQMGTNGGMSTTSYFTLQRRNSTST